MESTIADPVVNSNVIEPKYIAACLIGGIVVKLYDDLVDNALLKAYKNNHLLEFLKGLFFITFTFISLASSSFFIAFYIGNFLTFVVDADAWSNPYEKSLLFSTPLLFLFIDYSDIEILKLFKLFNDGHVFDLIFCILIIAGTMVETIFIKEEVSYNKIFTRLFGFVLLIISFGYFKSKFIKYLVISLIGYCFVSIGVQFYSLYLHKPTIDKENIVKKEETGLNASVKE